MSIADERTATAHGTTSVALTSDSQQMELELPNGGRVIVVINIFAWNVPVVPPPKPKAPALQFPVEGVAYVSIETEVTGSG